MDKIDVKEAMAELDDQIKLGSKIWAGVPDNFVSELRGGVMGFSVKMDGYDPVEIVSDSPDLAAIERVKKRIDTIMPAGGNHIVDVDGEKYGVTAIVSVNYEVRKL